jgi:hypothetical protein
MTSMSGYENSPDYGGRPVTRWAYVAVASVILLISLALIFWGMGP